LTVAVTATCWTCRSLSTRCSTRCRVSTWGNRSVPCGNRRTAPPSERDSLPVDGHGPWESTACRVNPASPANRESRGLGGREKGLLGEKGQPGECGEQGPRGEQGPTGKPGPAGPPDRDRIAGIAGPQGTAELGSRAQQSLTARDKLGPACGVEDRVQPRTPPSDDVHPGPDLRLDVRQHD
jgi:hypothetical protein